MIRPWLPFFLVGIVVAAGLGSYLANTLNQPLLQVLTVTRIETQTQTEIVAVTQTNSKVTASDYNFTLTVWLDRSTYRHGEPVVLRFNFTYTGDSTLKLSMPYGAFRVSLMRDDGASLAAPATVLHGYFLRTFTPGSALTGSATLRDGFGASFIYSGGDAGGGGPDIRLSPGHSYMIQGSMGFVFGDGTRRITAPPITIRILDEG